MRDIGEGTIRRIDWQELTPIVLLLRVFNTATGLRVMLLSLLGVLLTLLGGLLMPAVDPAAEHAGRAGAVVDLTDGDGVVVDNVVVGNAARETPESRFAKNRYLESLVDGRARESLSWHDDPARCVARLTERSVLVPWKFFTKTGDGFFQRLSLACFGKARVPAMSLLWPLLVVCVWTVCGGLICRTVALRLTIDQSESPQELWRFMKERGTGFLSSVVLVVLGVLVCLLPAYLGGLLYHYVPGLNYVVALFFPVPLLFGFFAVLLLVGLWFGWPLLFASVAVEGTDGFEAVSRMFSYLYQRPLHYFVYWLASGVLGVLGFAILSLFVTGVVYLTLLPGGFAVAEVPNWDVLRPETFLAASGSAPDRLVACWCILIRLALPAYVFAWFWTTGVAVYLLLRRSVDATPLVEVYRQGPAAAKPRTLPEIVTDAQGAPEVAD